MTQKRYRAVALDGFTIVLDLAEDRYLAIERGETASVGDLEDLALALDAAREEILIVDSARLSLPAPSRDLGRWDSHSDERLPLARDWIRLGAALPHALWSLKFGRPRTWIAYERTPALIADQEILSAARRFRRMRPLIPWLTRCLPHALLLRAYLARCGQASTLVIGVRVFPFEAHSWLQAGDLVLTDDIERLAGYTPIVMG